MQIIIWIVDQRGPTTAINLTNTRRHRFHKILISAVFQRENARESLNPRSLAKSPRFARVNIE